METLINRYKIESEPTADGRWRARIDREICVEEFGGTLDEAIQACLLSYLRGMSRLAGVTV